MTKTTVQKSTVQHIAALANIPITDAESQKLATAFQETMEVVDQLKTADVSQVETTHQVTGFKNVWREDVVREELSFTQEQALANAKHSYKGYFVVPYLLSNKDL
jgi:aspartyl/glutamyl-tRNA(Asn/Gln) amidotransferase C subunit